METRRSYLDRETAICVQEALDECRRIDAKGLPQPLALYRSLWNRALYDQFAIGEMVLLAVRGHKLLEMYWPGNRA